MIKRLLLAIMIAGFGFGAHAQDASSPLLDLLLMGTGLHTNDWGQQTNTNLLTIETAIAGAAAISTTGGNTTLTQTQGNSAVLVIGGALTANATITLAASSKLFGVINQTSGAFSVTFMSANSGTATVTVMQGTQAIIFINANGNVRLLAAESDAVTPAILTAVVAEVLPLAGGTMTGAINMGAHPINNLGAPAVGTDAATVNFVQASVATDSATAVAEIAAALTSAETFTTNSVATSQAASAAALAASQAALSAAITALVPSGAVMPFALSACPPGWLTANGTSGMVDMRGVVARGLDQGRGLDTTGTGLGGFEADQLQDHTHQVTGPVAINASTESNFTTVNSGTAVNSISFSAVVQTGIPNSGSHGTETRVKATVLLYCEKS